MEFHKESTYNPKKYLSACPGCLGSSYTCPQCQGPCIFSRVVFHKNNKHLKEFKMKLKDKYYKEDFEQLRRVILNHESIKKSPEEQEEIEDLDEYQLLEIFHANPMLYNEGLGKHICEYSSHNSRQWKKAGAFLGGAEMRKCYWHTKKYEPRFSYKKGVKLRPREEKKSRLLRQHNDFVLVDD